MFTLIFDPVATSGRREAGDGGGPEPAARALAALYEEVVVLTDFVKSSPPCPIAAQPNGASSPSGCSDPMSPLPAAAPAAAAARGGGILVPGERAREHRRRRRDQVAIDGGTQPAEALALDRDPRQPKIAIDGSDIGRSSGGGSCAV